MKGRSEPERPLRVILERLSREKLAFLHHVSHTLNLDDDTERSTFFDNAIPLIVVMIEDPHGMVVQSAMAAAKKLVQRQYKGILERFCELNLIKHICSALERPKQGGKNPEHGQHIAAALLLCLLKAAAEEDGESVPEARIRDMIVPSILQTIKSSNDRDAIVECLNILYFLISGTFKVPNMLTEDCCEILLEKIDLSSSDEIFQSKVFGLAALISQKATTVLCETFHAKLFPVIIVFLEQSTSAKKPLLMPFMFDIFSTTIERKLDDYGIFRNINILETICECITGGNIVCVNICFKLIEHATRQEAFAREYLLEHENYIDSVIDRCANLEYSDRCVFLFAENRRIGYPGSTSYQPKACFLVVGSLQ